MYKMKDKERKKRMKVQLLYTWIEQNQDQTIVLWFKIAKIRAYNWDDQNRIAETRLKWRWLDWWLDSLNCKTDSMNWDYLRHWWFRF